MVSRILAFLRFGASPRGRSLDLQPPLTRAVMRNRRVGLRHPHLVGVVVEPEDRGVTVAEFEVSVATNLPLRKRTGFREVGYQAAVSTFKSPAAHFVRRPSLFGSTIGRVTTSPRRSPRQVMCRSLPNWISPSFLATAREAWFSHEVLYSGRLPAACTAAAHAVTTVSAWPRPRAA